MRSTAFSGLALLASLACAAPIHAQAPVVMPLAAAGVPAGAQQASLRLSRSFGMRADVLLRDALLEGTRFELADKPSWVRAAGANIDFYPFAGGFRLSAGVRVDHRGFSGIAADDWGDGRTATKRSMRTLTLGYGQSLAGSLRVGVDGGLMLSDTDAPRAATASADGARSYPMVRLSISRGF